MKTFADAKASEVHMNLESPKDQTFYLPCFGLKTEPWLVAQWIEHGLQALGSLVQFPVRAHAWVVGQVPSRGS